MNELIRETNMKVDVQDTPARLGAVKAQYAYCHRNAIDTGAWLELGSHHVPWLIKQVEEAWKRIAVLEQAGHANVEGELASALFYTQKQVDTLRGAIDTFVSQCRREARNGFDFYCGFMDHLYELETQEGEENNV